jgi:serine/threonine-protein kinase
LPIYSDFFRLIRPTGLINCSHPGVMSLARSRSRKTSVLRAELAQVQLQSEVLLSIALEEVPMSDATPSRPSADRNLLFGILALQMEFITRDALIAAMHAWVLDKEKPLGQILVEQNALRADQYGALEVLVKLHLEQHGDDVEKSLAALGVPAPVREELHSLGDGDVLASLARIPTPSADDSIPTRQTTAERPNATGLRYHVLRPHGKGGLGEVFIALDQELNRQVALKEIRDEHADDPQSRGRFVREAEITGGLEHPGIVPVYGLGQYGDGRPFYAMRFIQGETLKAAIRQFRAGERGWTLRSLLARFVAVCNTLACAHSRGIVHRDIKPSNIMLGNYGTTLIVDWGLAKSTGCTLDQPLGDGPKEPMLVPRSSVGMAETHMGAALGTPAYMSPEQAAGRLDQLGPSSDIYSLGATLYTLLTGCPAVDSKDVAEALMRVQKGDWEPPRKVNPHTPPALNAIVCKAMAQLPKDRYASALELAADVERWLADDAVSALRDSVLSHIRRWGRRHRGITVALLTLLVTIPVTAASVASAMLLDGKQRETERAGKDAAEQKEEAERQASIAHDNQLRAEAEVRKASEIARFLTGMFEASDPIGLGTVSFYIPRRPDEKLKASDILKRGAEKIGSELEGEPVVKAAVMATIGDVCRSLGQYEQADQLLHAAYAIRERELPPDDLELGDSAQALGWYYREKGDYERGQKYYMQALKIRQQHLAPNDPRVLATLFNLAWLLTQRGDYVEAERLFREVIAEREKGPATRELALAHFGLAMMFLEKGEPLASAAPAAAGIRALQSLEGDRRLGQAVSLFQQGLLSAWVNKDRRQAIAKLKECLKIATQFVPETHFYIAFILYSIGELYYREQELDQALMYYEKSLRIMRDTVGLGHPKAAELVANYAVLLHQVGKDKLAEALCQELVQANRQRFGQDHPLVGVALATYARFRQICGDEAGAQKLLREAVDVYRGDIRWPKREYLSAVLTLADMLASQPEQRAQRQELLLLALHFCDRLDLKEPTEKALILFRLARSLEDEKQPQKIEEAERLLQEAYAMGRASKSPLVQKTILLPVLSAQSAHYRNRGQLQEAAEKARELRQVWPSAPDPAYAAACHFAALIALVGKEKAIQERYYEEAMKSLKQALENGLSNADTLSHDARLAPLKEWPEFQALMERLKRVK